MRSIHFSQPLLRRQPVLTVLVLLLSVLSARAQDTVVPETMNGMPLLFHETFDSGMGRWETTDSSAWAVVSDKGNPALVLFQQSVYEPPVRSPVNMALVQDLWLTDFVMEARVKSTVREYGHRDLCLFFGWQDPAHFYYVHLATAPDSAAHSIFLVDGAPRASVADHRTDGVRWIDGTYHTVRIVRSAEAGSIEVFFDDMLRPIMTAQDSTFSFGRLGVGSFDDLGLFDDIRIWGRRQQSP